VDASSKWDREAMNEATRFIPFNERSTYQSIASQLGIPKSTVFVLLKKEKIFVRATSAIKPTLSHQKKQDCVIHCIGKIEADGRRSNREDG
jgi:hypothetical protein